MKRFTGFGEIIEDFVVYNRENIKCGMREFTKEKNEFGDMMDDMLGKDRRNRGKARGSSPLEDNLK